MTRETSERILIAHACANKTRFDTAGEATKVIDKALLTECPPLACYECVFCNGWHLTRITGPLSKKSRKRLRYALNKGWSALAANQSLKGPGGGK